jgi:hypothetical protein
MFIPIIEILLIICLIWSRISTIYLDQLKELKDIKIPELEERNKSDNWKVAHSYAYPRIISLRYYESKFS